MENVGKPFFLKAVHAPLTEPRKNTQVHLRAIAIDVFRQLCYEAVRRRTCLRVASGWFLKTCVLFALNPCEQEVLREGFLIPSQIPHQLSFSTAGAKCRQMQTTETAEIQQDVGKYTPSATTVFRCGRCAILVLLRSPKVSTSNCKRLSI